MFEAMTASMQWKCRTNKHEEWQRLSHRGI